MIDAKLIDEKLLGKYESQDKSLAGRAKALLSEQKETWAMCAGGYKSLDSVKIKKFEFENCKIKVQFNPGRITSSAAKVDPKSIKERKCFLCLNHLPEEQKGLRNGNDYILLCNPFPIFPEHFTIPNVNHLQQAIGGQPFSDMLDLAREMASRYTIFYNGPKCGASAPDHMHFQAGDSNFMPVDSEYDSVVKKYGKLIAEVGGKSKVYAVLEGYLRRFISIESSDKAEAENLFGKFLKFYTDLSNNGEEPLLNVIVRYVGSKGEWRVIAFPREKHRPSYYFAEGDDNILLSPASVDMGGVLITPLEKDFAKITKENVRDIFDQVTIPVDKLEEIIKKF